jgi:hypothetical protein
MMVIGVLDHSHDGGADRAFRGFNRRDRVLAKDRRRRGAAARKLRPRNTKKNS